MKLKCITCEALARIVYHCAAVSPHVIDVELFEIGLHNEPPKLQAVLQSAVDAVPPEKYDAIILGYGLCGKATEGLRARRLPMILPRAHDCVTLFLGSRERYLAEFEEHTGTYWYSADYIERNTNPSVSMSLGVPTVESARAQYDEYVEKYGKDNADYLMEVMGGWQKHYQRAAYLDMGIFQSTFAEQKAQEDAQKNQWTFDRVAGNLVLIKRLLDGDWDAADFLRLEPGEVLRMSNDAGVLRAEQAQGSPSGVV
ncbi:MAG: DUF1638 domain-containing protein [Anaerolineae bacterium]|nr:DUF1638 domain-containing protein [Anaerolineae bacterium]